MPIIHPKFKNEKVCRVCGCSFLPEKGYEKIQEHCLDCAKLPEISVSFNQEDEPKQKKTKKCKKCGSEFIPSARANTICTKCKNNRR